jgi:hypothetical protein
MATPTPRTIQPPPDVPSMPDAPTPLVAYLRNFALWCRHGFADKISGSAAQPGLMLSAYDAPAGAIPPVFMFRLTSAGGASATPIALGGGQPAAVSSGAPIPIGSKIGVVDGSNAPAGQIGEVISSIVPVGVALTSGVLINLTSIRLTPGDWDVSGELWFTAGTGATLAQGAITPVSATMPNPPVLSQSRVSLNTPINVGQTASLALRPARANLTAATTYYLVANMTFASGTSTAWGIISARRMR